MSSERISSLSNTVFLEAAYSKYIAAVLEKPADGKKEVSRQLSDVDFDGAFEPFEQYWKEEQKNQKLSLEKQAKKLLIWAYHAFKQDNVGIWAQLTKDDRFKHANNFVPFFYGYALFITSQVSDKENSSRIDKSAPLTTQLQTVLTALCLDKQGYCSEQSFSKKIASYAQPIGGNSFPNSRSEFFYRSPCPIASIPSSRSFSTEKSSSSAGMYMDPFTMGVVEPAMLARPNEESSSKQSGQSFLR